MTIIHGFSMRATRRPAGPARSPKERESLIVICPPSHEGEVYRLTDDQKHAILVVTSGGRVAVEPRYAYLATENVTESKIKAWEEILGNTN